MTPIRLMPSEALFALRNYSYRNCPASACPKCMLTLAYDLRPRRGLSPAMITDQHILTYAHLHRREH